MKSTVFLKKALSVMLLLAIVLGITPLPAAAANDDPPAAAEAENGYLVQDNGYIKYYVDQASGGFYIMPSKEEFDAAKDPSFADIIIGGVQYSLGKEETPDLSFVNAEGTAQTVWYLNGYTVTQILNIIRDEQNQNSYGVFVGYEVTATSGASAQVSGRIVLDTLLGQGDDKPLVLSGVTQYITHEVLITEAPAYFRVDEVHGAGGYMAYGLLQDERLEAPAALAVGHFNNLYRSEYSFMPDTLLDFTSAENRYGAADSGIAYYYAETPCDEGTPAMFSTIYGFRDLEENVNAPAAPAHVAAQDTPRDILKSGERAEITAEAAVSTISVEFYRDGAEMEAPGAEGYEGFLNGNVGTEWSLPHSDEELSMLEIVVPEDEDIDGDRYHVSRIEIVSSAGEDSRFRLFQVGASILGGKMQFYAQMGETDGEPPVAVPAENIVLKVYVGKVYLIDETSAGERFSVSSDFHFQAVPQLVDEEFGCAPFSLVHLRVLKDGELKEQYLPAGAHVRMQVYDEQPGVVQGSVTPKLIGKNTSSVVPVTIKTETHTDTSTHTIEFVMPDEPVVITFDAEEVTTPSQVAADKYREGRENPLVRDISFSYERVKDDPSSYTTTHNYTYTIPYNTHITGTITVAVPIDGNGIAVSAKMTSRRSGVVTPVALERDNNPKANIAINGKVHSLHEYHFEFNALFGIQDFDVIAEGAQNNNNHVYIRSALDPKIADLRFPTTQRTFNIDTEYADFELDMKDPIYQYPTRITVAYHGNGVQDGFSEVLYPVAGRPGAYQIQPVGSYAGAGNVFRYGGTMVVSAEFSKYERNDINIVSSDGGELNYKMVSAVENDGRLRAYRLTPVELELSTKIPYTGYKIVSIADSSGQDVPYTATNLSDPNVYDGNWVQSLRFVMPDLKDVTITVEPYGLYRPMKVESVSTNDFLQSKATTVTVKGELLKQLKGEDGLDKLEGNDALRAATQTIYFGKSKDKAQNTPVETLGITYTGSGEVSFPIPAGVVTTDTQYYYVDVGPSQHTLFLTTNPLLRSEPYGILGIAADSANNHYVEVADDTAALLEKLSGKTLELQVVGQIKYDDATKTYTVKQGNSIFNGAITMSTTGDDHVAISASGGTVTLKATSPVDLSVPGMTFAKKVKPTLVFEKGVRYSGSYVENPTSTLKNISFAWGKAESTMGAIYTSFGIGAKLEDVKLLENSVVFGGEATLGAGDALNFGGINIERLQYGKTADNAFAYEGFKGSGSVGMGGTLSQMIEFGPKVTADVDTFARTYEFSAKFGFQLIEFEGSIALVPYKNTLVPNSISADIEMEPGVPIIPPIPVGYLKGGGVSLEGLGDTLNKNYSTLPPLKFKARAYFDLVKVFQFDPVELTVGPTQVSLTGNPKLGIEPFTIAPFSKFGMGYYFTEYADRNEITIKAEVELCLVQGFEIFVGGGYVDLTGRVYKNPSRFELVFVGELYCTVQIPQLFTWGPGNCWSVGPETLFKCSVGVSSEKIWYMTKILWVDVSLSYRWSDTRPTISSSSEEDGEDSFVVAETLMDSEGQAAGQAVLFENFRLLASSQAVDGARIAAEGELPIEDVSGGDKTKYRLTIPVGSENPTVFVSAPRGDMRVTDSLGNLVPLVYSKPADAIGRGHTAEELANPSVNAIDYSSRDENGVVNSTILLNLKPAVGADTWFIESGTAFVCDLVDVLPAPAIEDVKLEAGVVSWEMKDLNVMYPDETYTAEIYLSKDAAAVEGKDIGHHVASVPVQANAAGLASGTYAVNMEDLPGYAPTDTYYAWVYLVGGRAVDGSEEPEMTNYDFAGSAQGYAVHNDNQPDAVTGFAVESAGNGAVLASWQKLEGDNIGYRIQPFEVTDDGLAEVYASGDTNPTVYDVTSELAEELGKVDGFDGTIELAIPGLTAGKAYQFSILAYHSSRDQEGTQSASPVFGTATDLSFTIPVPDQPDLQVSFSSGTVIPAVEYSASTLITNGDFDIIMQSAQQGVYKVYIDDELKLTTEATPAGTQVIYPCEGLDAGSVTIVCTNAQGDYTSESYLIQTDTAAPILKVEAGGDGDILVAEDGSFTVTAYTEASAQVVVSGADAEGAVADASGRVSIVGNVADWDTQDGETERFVSISARDLAGNTTTEVCRLVDINSIGEAIESFTISPSGNISMVVGESVAVEGKAVARGKEYRISGSQADYTVTGSAVTLDAQTGIVTAASPGVATVRISYKGHETDALNIRVEAPAAVPVERVVLDQTAITLHPGETAELKATVEPEDAEDKAVTFSTTSERVARVDADGKVTAVAEGTATITATAGGKSAVCRVTVENVTGSLSFAKSHVALYNSAAPYTAGLDTTFTADELKIEVLDAATRKAYPGGGDILSAAFGAEAKSVSITPVAGKEGTAIVRVSCKADERIYAEMRVEVTAPIDAGKTLDDFADFRLESTTVTANMKSSLPALVSIYPQAGKPAMFLMASRTDLSFLPVKSGVDPAADPTTKLMTDTFTPYVVDERTVGLKVNDGANLDALKKASYKVKLACATDDFAGEKTFVGTLTIKINKKLPTLKAAKVTINTFYGERGADITVTGGEVQRWKLNETDDKKKAANAAVQAWLDTRDIGSGHVEVAALNTRNKGVLHLMVTLKGWGDDVWMPVSVAVEAKPTAPAVKLKAGSVKLYANEAASVGVPLAVVPKAKNAQFADMGITGLRILDSENELSGKEKTTYAANKDCIFELAEDYDPATGIITLRLKGGKSIAKTTKILLGAEVGPDDSVIRLPLTVKPVKVLTRVGLKAAPAKVTLNPGLKNGGEVTGEAYTFTLTPTVADFDLSGVTLEPKVWRGKTPADGELAVFIDGAKVTVATISGKTQFNKTYTLKLTAPGLNAHMTKGSKDATASLTVKTSKDIEPKVKLTASGKINLTTGTAATLTTKFTGTAYSYADSPTFTVLDSAGGAVADTVRDAFAFTRTGPFTWRVVLEQDRALEPGTYRVSVSGVLQNGTTVPGSESVKVVVTKTKPKITLSANKVSLYSAEPLREAKLAIASAGGAPAISDIKVKDSAANGYDIRPVGAGVYAIYFKDGQAPGQKKKLTLQIYLEGNLSVAATATVTVSVK